MKAIRVAAIRAGQQVESAVAVEVRQLRTELARASPLGNPTVGHLLVEPGGCAKDASLIAAKVWENL